MSRLRGRAACRVTWHDEPAEATEQGCRETRQGQGEGGALAARAAARPSSGQTPMQGVWSAGAVARCASRETALGWRRFDYGKSRRPVPRLPRRDARIQAVHQWERERDYTDRMDASRCCGGHLMTCASCGHTIRGLNRQRRYCDGDCLALAAWLRRTGRVAVAVVPVAAHRRGPVAGQRWVDRRRLSRLVDAIMARRLAEIRRQRNAA